ncbi:MAG: DUF3604 domain-containing protein [Myxococcales bacterium]|nr:DUF3604 domain-containing protein [Myxococcales bacterium]MDH3843243.1 DUF3604 domain-containing protein [Myxococcales bacterium]
MRSVPHIPVLFAIFAAMVGCKDSADANSCPEGSTDPECVAPPPDPCPDRNPLRNLYVGELHIHTNLSFDAEFAGVVAEPRDAYRFARGEALEIPPFEPASARRTVQLRRPLDFAAVTEHAELFGESETCTTEGADGYDTEFCEAWREQIARAKDATMHREVGELPPIFLQIFALANQDPPGRPAICDPMLGADCSEEEANVWANIQAQANEANRRCEFTTFNGYEWSGNPQGANIHRNVLFRNATVPSRVVSFETVFTPQGLWSRLRSECLEDLPGCDVLAIPHNSNFSQGLMFNPVNEDGSPLSAEDAEFRARMEPIVEVFQHKGSSECKPGILSNDERCGFESYDKSSLIGPPVPASIPPLSYVRNGLKEGLVQEESIGVNPFQFGMIGATDGHNADSGKTNENDYRNTGHTGSLDWEPRRILAFLPASGIESNGGGLAFVWAEENTRDAIFDALRRREVYATSGTRPVLRMFGGWDIPTGACDMQNLIEVADQNGVPMGGTLPALPEGESPSPKFFISALQDPGSEGAPGTPLERIQVVKGWVDNSGEAQEKVFDVAGGDRPADVDINTCETSGEGYPSLCTVWTDPEFDPTQRAFYYARILENPVCRWSTLLCNELEVDCSDIDNVPEDFAACCHSTIEAQRSIQERAWSSPIWHTPEAP